MSIPPQVISTLLCFGAAALVIGLALWAVVGSSPDTLNYTYQRRRTHIPLSEITAKSRDDVGSTES